MNKLAIYLNQHIDGMVYSAPAILEKYSTDRSVLSYKPRLVAVPANVMDVRRLVKFSSQLAAKGMEMPITVRGAGYSKTGSAIGSGIVMLMERLNRIQEIDSRQRLVRVQAGVTLAELRTALEANALELPIVGDPHETIGGLISNCVSASVNTKPGTIIDFIEDMEVVLADGSLLQSGQATTKANSSNEKTLGLKCCKMLNSWLTKNSAIFEKMDNAGENRSWYPGIKDVCGKRGFKLAPIFCGAEGTLGVITEVILRVEPIFESPNYIAIPCANVKEFTRAIKVLKEEKFTDIVFYSSEIFAEIEKTGKSLKFFRTKPSKDGFLLVANAKDDSRTRRKVKIRAIQKKLPESIRVIIADRKNIGDFAAIQENLIAYLSESNLEYRVPVVDQVYIPEEKRAEFVTKLDELSKEVSMRLPLYGSVDYNTYTIRPKLRPDDMESYKKLIMVLRKYIAIVKECDGNICGGSPEGRFLAPFMKAETNPAILELNRKVKEIFDENGIFNPGIKHEADARLIFRHFRDGYGGEFQSSF
jgi:FAD/FMN-containing dehydrogenase